MALIFIPFVSLFFVWRDLHRTEWIGTFYFLVYAIYLTFFVELPDHHRIGSFAIGVPFASYMAILFPSWQQEYPEGVLQVLGFGGITVTFISLLVLF